MDLRKTQIGSFVLLKLSRSHQGSDEAASGIDPVYFSVTIVVCTVTEVGSSLLVLNDTRVHTRILIVAVPLRIQAGDVAGIPVAVSVAVRLAPQDENAARTAAEGTLREAGHLLAIDMGDEGREFRRELEPISAAARTRMV